MNPEKEKNTFKKLDMADYAKKSFGMFGGKEKTVNYQCIISWQE